MASKTIYPTPYLICCGLPIIWEFLEEAWFASCYRCGRDFIYSDPLPCGLPDNLARSR